MKFYSIAFPLAYCAWSLLLTTANATPASIEVKWISEWTCPADTMNAVFGRVRYAINDAAIAAGIIPEGSTYYAPEGRRNLRNDRHLNNFCTHTLGCVPGEFQPPICFHIPCPERRRDQVQENIPNPNPNVADCAILVGAAAGQFMIEHNSFAEAASPNSACMFDTDIDNILLECG